VNGSTLTLPINSVNDQPLGVSIMFGTKVTDVRVAGGMRSQGPVYVVLK
jgi:hypothetical protein